MQNTTPKDNTCTRVSHYLFGFTSLRTCAASSFSSVELSRARAGNKLATRGQVCRGVRANTRGRRRHLTEAPGVPAPGSAEKPSGNCVVHVQVRVHPEMQSILYHKHPHTQSPTPCLCRHLLNLNVWIESKTRRKLNAQDDDDDDDEDVIQK